MSNLTNRLLIALAMGVTLLVLTANLPTVSAASPCTGTVHTVTVLTNPDDTYVNQSDPAVNYGADAYMVAGRDLGRKVSLMHFNGLGLPQGACVQKAKLKVYVADPVGATPQPVRACRIAGVWNGFAVTWATRPPQAPVCSPSVGMVAGWNTFDVPNVVQDWADGIPNDGLALRPLGVPGYMYYINAYDSGTNIPRLIVTYQDPS